MTHRCVKFTRGQQEVSRGHTGSIGTADNLSTGAEIRPYPCLRSVPTAIGA